ncbi:hypothetical protein ND856_00420 [Leptospira bandrabouensis]|uniref:hypothetical protein n=1 Tax=Leptospira bandrabouensis TaxID=2484903 RepID=UPI00223CF1F3|nr:hypothetical protein [Leptospira bandrabouensis]MCW7456784.1 hypothetical protein [Leptospira bandrabouensis]MCW7475730.1 hypothetical protein [Leptospira bandrabouensis]MCW7483412.1 hypothetical protein [Leptospira bandrabouensis]
MKKFLCLIIFSAVIISCKNEEVVLGGKNVNSGKIDYKRIESHIIISDGSILRNSAVDFDGLEKFNPRRILKDFDFFGGKEQEPYILIKAIDSSSITLKVFNQSIVFFEFGYEGNNIEYNTQTYSPFDTAGSNSKGIIKEVKCSNYTDTFIKCKFYFGTATPANGMPPMSWVIVTIKDRALVNVEDDLGASFLGYIDTDKKYPERYLSNLKKALKVAVKDPEIGLKDVQLRGFSIEELDLLTDGLASQVKAGK